MPLATMTEPHAARNSLLRAWGAGTSESVSHGASPGSEERAIAGAASAGSPRKTHENLAEFWTCQAPLLAS